LYKGLVDKPGELKTEDQKMQDLKMKDLPGMRRAFVVGYNERL